MHRLSQILTYSRTFVRKVTVTPPATMCTAATNCLSDKLPLLKNQRVGLIDPDTPTSAYTKTSRDGTSLKLVVRIIALR